MGSPGPGMLGLVPLRRIIRLQSPMKRSPEPHPGAGHVMDGPLAVARTC